MFSRATRSLLPYYRFWHCYQFLSLSPNTLRPKKGTLTETLSDVDGRDVLINTELARLNHSRCCSFPSTSFIWWPSVLIHNNYLTSHSHTSAVKSPFWGPRNAVQQSGRKERARIAQGSLNKLHLRPRLRLPHEYRNPRNPLGPRRPSRSPGKSNAVAKNLRTNRRGWRGG